MRSKFPLAVLSAAFLAIAAPAWAQSVKGTVTKVDPAAGKVTLDHAAIPKLDMDAMTMAYPVKDPAMLKDLKAGDKVDFDVEEAGGAVVAGPMDVMGLGTMAVFSDSTGAVKWLISTMVFWSGVAVR